MLKVNSTAIQSDSYGSASADLGSPQHPLWVAFEKALIEPWDEGYTSISREENFECFSKEIKNIDINQYFQPYDYQIHSGLPKQLISARLLAYFLYLETPDADRYIEEVLAQKPDLNLLTATEFPWGGPMTMEEFLTPLLKDQKEELVSEEFHNMFTQRVERVLDYIHRTQHSIA